jgi:hypothetical protein
MIATLLVWLVMATIMEYVIVVAPLDIKSSAKLVLYYVMLAPYLALVKTREYLGTTGWFEALSKWFKTL